MAAIYMWPLNNQVILTTTLYPVDVTEMLEFSATLSSGYMAIIPHDIVYADNIVLNGTYIQKRWFYSVGPFNDYVYADTFIPNGSYIQKRWFYNVGPFDDNVYANAVVLDGAYNLKLIEADTPDEELQLNTVIYSSACVMELI